METCWSPCCLRIAGRERASEPLKLERLKPLECPPGGKIPREFLRQPAETVEPVRCEGYWLPQTPQNLNIVLGGDEVPLEVRQVRGSA
jgi:hypothetical protein